MVACRKKAGAPLEIRDLLKSGSLTVIGVLLAFYICGWQYYLGLFHALGVTMHFVLPPEYAIGAGMHPILVFLLVFLAGAGLGLSWSTCSKYSRWIERRPLLAPSMAAALVVLPAPWLLETYSHSVLTAPMQFGWALRFQLLFASAVLGVTAAYIACRDWVRTSDHRYYFYFVLTSALLVGACRYADFLGAADAAKLGSNPHRIAYASIQFSDEALQLQCGGTKFAPLLTVGEDVYLVQAQVATKTSGLCSADGSNSKRLLVVKKSLVQAVSLTRTKPPESIPTSSKPDRSGTHDAGLPAGLQLQSPTAAPAPPQAR